MGSVFKNWWARKKILGLPEEKRSLMRLQLLAHQFLGKKKQVCGDLFVL